MILIQFVLPLWDGKNKMIKFFARPLSLWTWT